MPKRVSARDRVTRSAAADFMGTSDGNDITSSAQSRNGANEQISDSASARLLNGALAHSRSSAPEQARIEAEAQQSESSAAQERYSATEQGSDGAAARSSERSNEPASTGADAQKSQGAAEQPRGPGASKSTEKPKNRPPKSTRTTRFSLADYAPLNTSRSPDDVVHASIDIPTPLYDNFKIKCIPYKLPFTTAGLAAITLYDKIFSTPAVLKMLMNSEDMNETIMAILKEAAKRKGE